MGYVEKVELDFIRYRDVGFWYFDETGRSLELILDFSLGRNRELVLREVPFNIANIIKAGYEIHRSLGNPNKAVGVLFFEGPLVWLEWCEADEVYLSEVRRYLGHKFLRHLGDMALEWFVIQVDPIAVAKIVDVGPESTLKLVVEKEFSALHNHMMALLARYGVTDEDIKQFSRLLDEYEEFDAEEKELSRRQYNEWRAIVDVSELAETGPISKEALLYLGPKAKALWEHPLAVFVREVAYKYFGFDWGSLIYQVYEVWATAGHP